MEAGGANLGAAFDAESIGIEGDKGEEPLVTIIVVGIEGCALGKEEE